MSFHLLDTFDCLIEGYHRHGFVLSAIATGNEILRFGIRFALPLVDFSRLKFLEIYCSFVDGYRRLIGVNKDQLVEQTY